VSSLKNFRLVGPVLFFEENRRFFPSGERCKWKRIKVMDSVIGFYISVLIGSGFGCFAKGRECTNFFRRKYASV